MFHLFTSNHDYIVYLDMFHKGADTPFYIQGDDIVVFILISQQGNQCYCEWNVCLNINICNCLVPYVTNFHSLELGGRSSETQLQVCQNLSKITEREKG